MLAQRITAPLVPSVHIFTGQEGQGWCTNAPVSVIDLYQESLHRFRAFQ